VKRQVTFVLIAAALLIAAVTVLADKDMMPAAKEASMKMATVGEVAPNFTLTDVSGKKHSLAEYKGKYVVLEWINFGCPFVVKHYGSGNMPSLQKKYEEQGVVWLAVCSSAPGKQGHYEGTDLMAAIEDNGCMANAYLIDSDGAVGRMYNAKTTPNMYVLDPSGKLIYAGAIDDKPTTSQSDVKGATNYVQEALDAAMAGKPVAVSNTQPYGCGVKY